MHSIIPRHRLPARFKPLNNRLLAAQQIGLAGYVDQILLQHQAVRFHGFFGGIGWNMDRIPPNEHAARKRQTHQKPVPTAQYFAAAGCNRYRNQRQSGYFRQINRALRRLEPGPTRPVRRDADGITLADFIDHFAQRRRAAARCRPRNRFNAVMRNRHRNKPPVAVMRNQHRRLYPIAPAPAHDQHPVMPKTNDRGFALVPI